MVTKSIIVNNLSKRYGETKVFSNLNININKGDFVTLMGPNGCGKSTLVNSIAGLIDYCGEIKRNDNIGLVTQNPDELLLPWVSVKNNIIFPKICS